MPLPRAYFLTWTTYGTWLPGDRRGSVDSEHNGPGAEYAPSSSLRREKNIQSMVQAPFTLGASGRRLVHQAILDHCAFRGWELVALNVRSNHVHAVVRCGETDPKRAAPELKAWATRQPRLRGGIADDRRVWTERGSARYLWDEEGVKAAVAYVMDGQGVDLQ